MRVLDGEQTLVRIFIGEGDRWRHQPLDRALLERLRAEGFAGATVLRGLAGFGANSVIHTAKIVDLAARLPVPIEGVDRDRLLTRPGRWTTSPLIFSEVTRSPGALLQSITSSTPFETWRKLPAGEAIGVGVGKSRSAECSKTAVTSSSVRSTASTMF